jgi:hypothetical protein
VAANVLGAAADLSLGKVRGERMVSACDEALALGLDARWGVLEMRASGYVALALAVLQVNNIVYRISYRLSAD